MNLDDEMKWTVLVMAAIAALVFAIWLGEKNYEECESKGFSTRYCLTH